MFRILPLYSYNHYNNSHMSIVGGALFTSLSKNNCLHKDFLLFISSYSLICPFDHNLLFPSHMLHKFMHMVFYYINVNLTIFEDHMNFIKIWSLEVSIHISHIRAYDLFFIRSIIPLASVFYCRHSWIFVTLWDTNYLSRSLDLQTLHLCLC